MPQEAYYVIRIVHMLSMAMWFAAPLAVTSDLKRTIARGKPHTDFVVPRVSRSLTIATVGAVLTILSGLGMIFALGGFKAVHPRIHAGFALALVTLSLEFFLVKGGLARIGAELDADKVRDLPPLVKRFAMFTGITHLLKTVILVLMVVRFGGR